MVCVLSCSYRFAREIWHYRHYSRLVGPGEISTALQQTLHHSLVAFNEGLERGCHGKQPTITARLMVFPTTIELHL